MTYFNAIRYSDSGSLDAFARLRTSFPFTIFDSKQLNDKAPLFWDEVISNVSGNATSTHSTTDAATTMAVGANAGDYIIRQTKNRFNYQPGKSQLIIMTGVMSKQSGVTKRIGYFNSSIVAPHTADFDGVYFENDGTDVSINTAKTGTIDKITQANWNVGLAMLYSRNFISTNPLCETIGNAERNAACRPSGLRLSGGTSFCRKATQLSVCMVSR